MKKSQPKLFKTSDAKLNPALADQIATVRGGMAQAAESVAIPHRFVVTDVPNDPSVLFTDTETGRSTQVALCDYRGVRQALADLFG